MAEYRVSWEIDIEADGLVNAAPVMIQRDCCWECGGSGIDAGSLNEPEPCPICYGTGVAPEEEEEIDMPTFANALLRGPRRAA